MVDDDDRAIFLKPIVERAGIPAPHSLALDLATSRGHVAERIIDQQDMSAAAHHRRANTDREIAAALLGVPSAASRAVLCEAGVKNLRVLLRHHEVAHV